MSDFDVLIIGSGHAGAQAAATLRREGFEGSIGLAGAESEFPYERPSLSKDYLYGDKPFERMLIRPAVFWQERRINLLPGHRAVRVDPVRRLVLTDDGVDLGYGRLIWAAGGDPRHLSCSGASLAGVHTVRTRADIDRILSELSIVETIVVIGGGYIGLEVAAALRKLNKAVILLEAQNRVLARVTSEPVSRFFEAIHLSRGVDVRPGAQVERLEGIERITAVRLADGERVPCQMVIVGIGVVPAVLPLIEAGAHGGDGVDVDDRCATSLPDVFAIGDCARHRNRFANGASVRLESVQNAFDQATVVARVIVGQDVRYDTPPWFWSQQYEFKLQTIGLSGAHDRLIVRGDPRAGAFSVVYLRDDTIIALDCVNRPTDFIQGRTLLLTPLTVAPDRLSNIDQPLRELAG